MLFSNFPADASRLSQNLSCDGVTFGFGHRETLIVIYSFSQPQPGKVLAMVQCWSSTGGGRRIDDAMLKEVPEN